MSRKPNDEAKANQIVAECERINEFVDKLFDETAIAEKLKQASTDLRDLAVREYQPNKKAGRAGETAMKSTALLILKLYTDEALPPEEELNEAMELILDITPARYAPHPARYSGKLRSINNGSFDKAVSSALRFPTIKDVPAEQMAQEALISRTEAFALKAEPDFIAVVEAKRKIIALQAEDKAFVQPKRKFAFLKAKTLMPDNERTPAARAASEAARRKRALGEKARFRDLKRVLRKTLLHDSSASD